MIGWGWGEEKKHWCESATLIAPHAPTKDGARNPGMCLYFLNVICTFVYSFCPFPPNIFKLHSESKSINATRLSKVVKLLSQKVMTNYTPTSRMKVLGYWTLVYQYHWPILEFKICATFIEKIIITGLIVLLLTRCWTL